ncbi:MAG: class I SAM-dependent methyltransferase family protein [Candidatus Lokiarchaeota archaeon]|nr:class I SAM-dependent methyltransferase family protein [Candidatus Lokiarchaeota archaeon]
MTFKKKLIEKLNGIITDEELSILPRGFQTLGNIIILKLNPKLLKKKKKIGQTYLDLLPKIRSVYVNKGRIIGSFREPENIEFLVGKDDPIVEHKEHGIKYRFDITKIMFSQGNLSERRFLATLVKKGEIVVDMFAGMGYFSLPIAKHSEVEQIYSIELNPTSYKTLLENIKINHLEEKITAINGDSKKEVLELSKSGLRADRVIMGVFPAPKEYIKEALSLIKEEGTIYHYEGVVEKEGYISLFKDFKEICQEEQFNCKLESHRFVKSYGPNLYHTVLDILVRKN